MGRFSSQEELYKIFVQYWFYTQLASQSITNAIVIPSIGGLIEVKNSSWISSLKQTDTGKSVDSMFKLKHYAVFIEGSGQYEFLASGFDIISNRDEKYYSVSVEVSFNNLSVD